jgi:D-3-phosphoglycerate dehydrogenase
MVDVLRLLGADIVGVDPYIKIAGVVQETLDEAVREADVLSLHCSLQREDEGLIGARVLSRCKRGMILVNTARGGLVNWEAAIQSLDDGRLSTIVADVFPEEPWPRMRGGRGMVLTPHSAGYNDQLSERLAAELLETVVCFTEGTALPHALY